MKTKTMDDNRAVLEGDLERIAYFNERTHYTIARLKTAALARPVTLVGFMGGVQPGETIHVSGHWETHPKYGQQLRVKTYEVKLPATVQGIRQYLKSGIVKGLGPQLVERLVNRFGADTLSVIEEDPGRLTEVEGIGKGKASLIVAAWNEHHVLRALMRFLQEKRGQDHLRSQDLPHLWQQLPRCFKGKPVSSGGGHPRRGVRDRRRRRQKDRHGGGRPGPAGRLRVCTAWNAMKTKGTYSHSKAV